MLYRHKKVLKYIIRGGVCVVSTVPITCHGRILVSPPHLLVSSNQSKCMGYMTLFLRAFTFILFVLFPNTIFIVCKMYLVCRGVLGIGLHLTNLILLNCKVKLNNRSIYIHVCLLLISVGIHIYMFSTFAISFIITCIS